MSTRSIKGCRLLPGNSVVHIIQTVREMQRWSEDQRLERKTIAFVPTMGFLHEGHLQLVREAKNRGDVVVVSIFVNPMQFNQASDFDKYPRNEAQDEHALKELGTDVLFMPRPAEIYPDDYQTAVEVEKVSQPLCGAFRPGHFRGGDNRGGQAVQYGQAALCVVWRKGFPAVRCH